MAQYRTSTWKELFVTHVKGEGVLLKFWGLPTGAVEIVKSFELHFQKGADSFESQSGFIRSDQIPNGFKCAVNSKVKQQWCRAIVLSALGLSEILVQLMDYGTMEQVSVADVRTLDDTFFRYPAQATECILGDVVPANGAQWSLETIKFCEEELLYKTMSCLIMGYFANIPIARIAKKGETDPFVQRLINNGLALIKQESQKAPNPHNVAHPLGYKMNNLNPSTSHLVKISFIENHHKFYVQLAAAELELTNLMEEIRVYTSRVENLCLVNTPQINTPCLADIKHRYCRGLIMSVNRGQCVVSYVDYGCTEVKDFQELRALPPHFLKLHAQAICCTLPRDIQMNSDEFLRIVSKYVLLECQIIGHTGDAYIVQLKIQGQDIFMPQHFPLPNNPLPIQNFNYKQHKLPVNKSYEVTIGFINDISEFYCQLVRNKEQLDAITSILSSKIDLPAINLQECLPKLPVIVKFSEDNIWYRAQIVKVIHEHDIEVFFVDYGNYDNATLRDIRKINVELLNFPVQAFKCSLFDLEVPADSSTKDEMLDFFEEVTAGQALQAQVKDISEGSTGLSYNVILQENGSPSSVNEKIETKFTTFSTIPVSDVEKLYITNFSSLDSFFGQFEKLSTTKLEEMQDEMNAFYADARNTSFKPKPTCYVIAKYNLDEQYYRARVESSSGRTCDVMFIDYGNRESIALEDIHPLNKKFLKYPQFGIECALDHYPPATPVDKVHSLMLENSIQAKMVKEESRKWLISLSEDFAPNAPVLEILRQHEKIVPRSIHGAGLRGFQDDPPRRDNVRPYSPVKDFNDTRNSYQAPPKLSNFRSQSNEINSNEYPVFENKNANQVEEPKDYTKVAITSNAYRNVYVSHVISPGDFYCQIEEESTKLTALMQDIENSYAQVQDNELNLKELKVGSTCCAVFQEDGTWYRGRIKDVNSRQCNIYFVDYGNTDYVPLSKVKTIKPNLLELPTQALKCKLYNVTTQNGVWSDAAIQDFVKQTLDKSFVAQFVEMDSTGTYAVNLVPINKLEEDILNKQFVNLGHGQLQDKNKILVLNSHAASNNITFKTPEVKLGSFEPVTVKYGLNPQEIFLQLKSTEYDFKKLMENLQQYYNKLSPSEAIVDRPHSDMICVAQFFLDSAWYRGKITNVDKNSITVLYVDYGNFETVDRKKIRCIAQDFTALPIQAIKCHIKGIVPPGGSWPSNCDVSKYFDGDAQCQFVSKEEDYYIINLTCNQKNVADQLIDAGLAIGDGSTPKQPDHNETPKNTTKPSFLVQSFPKRVEFISGQLLSVLVSYTESPFKFWCQLLDETDALEQLMADVQAHIELGIQPVRTEELAEGCYCLAKYSEDQSWYRAQIKSCLSTGEYEVFYIDYGNTEVTSLAAISTLPPELMKIHRLCFDSQLLGASPSCTNEVMEAFQAVVNEAGEDMTAKVERVSGHVYVITLLYEVDDVEKNVSEVLFGSEAVSLSTTEAVKFLPPDVPLGLQEGYVSIVNSPHDFFIQLAGCEDNLAELATELSEKCEAMEPGEDVLQNVCIGSACAAKFSEDNSWYRAEVMHLQETTVDVLFVDYGNASNVPMEGLKTLNEKFLSVPPYAIKCKLNGIIPSAEQWSESAINTFQDLVTDASLGVTFICKDIPAIVNVSKDDKDVAQNLIDLELASIDTCTETNEAYADDHLTAPIEDQLHSLPFDQSYPKRKLSSTKLPVKICYVDSFNKFFIMPLELSTEVDTVMKTLEILYAQSAEESDSPQKTSIPDVLEDPRAFLPCVAKYSADDAWYRARITEVEGESIYVSFVDYGNSEVSPLKNLKPLTPELLKIPPVAVECSLYAIQAVEGKEQELTAKLEELYMDEVELEMELYKPEEPYHIRLYQSGCDIAEIMCQDGLAVEVIPPPETVSIDAASEISCNLTDDLKENIKVPDGSSVVGSLVPRRIVTAIDGISISVKHSEVEDERIILHGVPVDLEEQLTSFQEKLQSAYSEDQPSLSQIENSGFCVAKYLEDENWYRAQILSCSEDDIKVQFIDYGNSEIVNSNELRELLPVFADEPQFSIRFCPLGVKVEKADDVQGKLDEALYDEPVLLHLCKYSHSHYGVCFTSLICGSHDFIETLINESIISQVYTPSTDLEKRFEATVKNVSDSVFYILPVKLSEKRNDLQERLVERCCDIPTLSEKISPSRLYAAKVEDKWQRSSVLTTSDTAAVVRCVDFGIDATVEFSLMALLPEEFLHEPLLLQSCTIQGFEDMPLENQQKVLERVKNEEIFHFEVETPSTSTDLLLVKLLENVICDTEESVICEADVEVSHQNANTNELMIESKYNEVVVNECIEHLIEGNGEDNETIESLPGTHHSGKPSLSVKSDEEFQNDTEDDQLEGNERKETIESLPISESDQSESFIIITEEEKAIENKGKEDEQSSEQSDVEAENEAGNEKKETIESLPGTHHSEKPDEEFKNDAEDDQFSLSVYEEQLNEGSNFIPSISKSNQSESFVTITEEDKASENMSKDDEQSSEQSDVEAEIEASNQLKLELADHLNAAVDVDQVELEDKLSTDKEIDQEEKYVDDYKENEKNTEDHNEEMEKFVNDDREHEKLLDDDKECDESLYHKNNCKELAKDNRGHEEVDDGCDLNGEEEIVAHGEIPDSEEEKENFNVEENKENIDWQKADNTMISETTAHTSDNTWNEESDNYESVTLQEKECEKLQELSDVESEIKSFIKCEIEKDNQNLRSECSEGSGISEESYHNYLNDHYHEPESAEQVTSEAVDKESSNSERIPSDLNVAKAVESKPGAQLPDVRSDEDDQKDISESQETNDSEDILNVDNRVAEGNEWDERPECDIKSELVDNLVTGLSDAQMMPEDQPLPDSSSSPLEDAEDSVPVGEYEATESTNILGSFQTLTGKQICSENADSEESRGNMENLVKEQEIEFKAECDVFPVKQLSDLAGEAYALNQLTGVSPTTHHLTDTVVTISHVAMSNGSIIFAVTPKNLFPQLSELKGILQRMSSLKQPPLNSMSVSELYAVCFDGEWHRGKVLDTKESTVTVMFIDSGLCNDVEFSALRELKEEYKAVPPFALWCVLACAYCPPESTGVLTYLEEVIHRTLTTKQDITVKVVRDEEPYKVNLYIEGNDIMRILLEGGQVVQHFPDDAPTPGKHPAKISHFKSLKSGNSVVYVNLVSQLEDLKKLESSMQDAYNADSSDLPVVESGAYAVEHNGIWARGEAVASGEGLSIFLIDSGKSIDVGNVYPLISEHCLLPPFSIPCELDIENASMECDISHLLSVLSEEEFLVQVETLPTNSFTTKILDEHFLLRLKKVLGLKEGVVNGPSKS